MRWLEKLHRKPDDWQADIERRLKVAFPPVAPRAEFRAHLKTQLLAHMPARVEIQRRARPQWTRRVLWIGLAVAGALTLVVNGIRVVISLLAALGLLHKARKHLEEQEQASTPPLQAA